MLTAYTAGFRAATVLEVTVHTPDEGQQTAEQHAFMASPLGSLLLHSPSTVLKLDEHSSQTVILMFA